MITVNPFAQLLEFIPPIAMQGYVLTMLLLVVGGVVLDMIHKKSAKYFFGNSKKLKENATRKVSGGEKALIALKTVTEDVLTSAEFCNTKRRAAHLLTMYGFVIFVATTIIMIFSLPATEMVASTILPQLWHISGLMLTGGVYWFWFFIRVDMAVEGNKWYRVVRADLFSLSLMATSTFALIWSYLQSTGGAFWATLFFGLFVFSSTVLFAGVLWSKFAHMFFKPVAAFQRRMTEADGSRENLPKPADKPEKFGLGIKREAPLHY